MAELFLATKQNVSLHIKNIFKEQELDEVATVKEYLTVQKEGQRNGGHDRIGTDCRAIIRLNPTYFITFAVWI